MIAKIITYCFRNRNMTLAIALALGLWGVYCWRNIRIDALPDLSDTQVIIFSEWMGRSPDLIENQITYPLVTSLVSAPKVKVVRGQSMFGMSFVYVIFQDGTDIYWARSRVLELLSKISGNLPEGVSPSIGPDATGVGWIYQYALVDRSGNLNLAEIRTFQDWYLRFWLAAVPGVAEVASVGGFEKQYQVEVDPNRLAALNISLGQVVSAIRQSNQDVGGRTVEISEREYYVRGRGYVTKPGDLAQVAVAVGPGGIPIRIADLGRVSLGPNIRRGVSDFNGRGDTVGGVLVMRQGEDASRVIAAVKEQIKSLKSSFPAGLELVPVYDRSGLIREAVATLQESLLEEVIIVCIVILLFLLHLRSALVVVLTLPLSVLISLIPMYYLGIGMNIMSLGGIILAVGDVVDGIIVFIENAHKKISERPDTNRDDLVLEACTELGPALFSSLLIIAVSFLPLFALQAEEGRLFHPLAFTKTFAMIASALVSITVSAPLIALLLKGRVRTEEQNPLNRVANRAYARTLTLALRRYPVVLAMVAILVGVTAFGFTRLGSEFMPPLWEGDLLYMPITVPGIGITAVSDLLVRQGEAIKKVPEVETVFGKAGRFDTPTDPAPLSMLEFTVRLKPKDQWRKGLSQDELVADLDRAVVVPGLNRAWTKPVRGRVDMLSTGIRTPVGVKVFGKDLSVIEDIGKQIERSVKDIRGTRSVYAERIAGGYYLDFEPDRAVIQRYGLRIGDVQMVIESAIGGMDVSQTVEGRERYSINVRYPRELRDNVAMLSRVLVATPTGTQVPLGELGRIVTRSGPPMILDENGMLAGYIYIDLEGRDPGSYVAEAKLAVSKMVAFPPGYFITWTGQYEYLARMRDRMKIVLPLTLLLVFALLYLAMRSVAKTMLIMVSVPLSLTGGILLMWGLHYNTSVAVWAGAIALIGVAVETTSIMVVFLDQAWKDHADQGRLQGADGSRQATLDGAGRSLRPVLMAVGMNIFGLIPVMVATGLGADVMRRLSTPMFGGLLTLTFLTLIVVPTLYWLYERRHHSQRPGP